MSSGHTKTIAQENPECSVKYLTIIGRDNMMCVTDHGHGFLITLTFGVISVKYSYNGKNVYHCWVSDIIGEMYDTKYATWCM